MRSLIFILVLSFATGVAQAQSSAVRVIAASRASGVLGPGRNSPEQFLSFDAGPHILDNGTPVFPSTIFFAGPSLGGVWVHRDGINVPLAITGDLAPGLPGSNPWIAINPYPSVRGGTFTIFGEMSGTYRYGLWAVRDAATLSLSLRSREAVAGLGQLTYVEPLYNCHPDTQGSLWGSSIIGGRGVDQGNNVVINRVDPNQPAALLYRTGDRAVGFPPSATIAGIAVRGVSSDRTVMMSLAVDLNDGQLLDIYLAQYINGQLVVRANLEDQAPGCPPGVSFGRMERAWAIDGGGFAFYTRLAGPGVTEDNNEALFIDRGPGLRLVFREGDLIPAWRADAQVSVIRKVDVSATGRVAALIDVRLTVPFTIVRSGLFLDDAPAGSRFAVRQNASGLPGAGNRIIKDFRELSTGPGGHTVFKSGLDGPGAGPNEEGLWIINPNNAIRFVMRSGDPIEPPGLPVNTAARFTFHPTADIGSSNRSVVAQPINRYGDLAFVAFNETSSEFLLVAEHPDCPADFNNDGLADLADYLAFVACFEEMNCQGRKTADFNGDGFVDLFDYSDFLTAYESGC